MGIFLPHNINYKDKPQQYGDFSFVQSSLFENADRIGVEPDKIELAMPMWNAGDQQDYSKNGLVGINYGASYDKNCLNFNGTDNYISLVNKINELPFTIISLIKPTSFLDTGKAIVSISNTSATGIQHALIISDTGTGNPGNDLSAMSRVDGKFHSGTASISLKLNKIETISGWWKSSYYREAKIHGKNKGYNSSDITPTNLNNISIGRLGDSTPNWYFQGNIYYLIGFSQTLKSDQIAFLSDNPYYLWQPRNKRTWFIPVDATGGNIFQVSCSDAFNFNDASTRTAIFSVIANETLSLSDAPDNVGNFLSSAISQILMTDQTSTRIIALGNVTDSISINDTANVLSSITGLVSDSVMLSDKSSSTGIFQGNATDSVTFADAVVNSLLLQGVVNEIISLSDSASLGSFLQGIVSDSISFSDSAVNTATLISAIQENITLSDSAVNILNTFASASDTINLSDMSAWGAFKQALAISGFNLTDSATNNLLTFAQAADSITFDDNAHMNVTFNVEVKDAVSFAETVSKIAIFQAAVSDSVNFSATAMEISQLPNRKVVISFDVKIPEIGFDVKTSEIGFDVKVVTINFNLI